MVVKLHNIAAASEKDTRYSFLIKSNKLIHICYFTNINHTQQLSNFLILNR